ncbi:hypothetical protein ACFQ51_20670 [Streptomyces kaempferi]
MGSRRTPHVGDLEQLRSKPCTELDPHIADYIRQMTTEERMSCAFCMETTDVGLSGDGVTLTITRAGEQSTQFVWAHLSCLDERLHRHITRGPWLDD